MSTTWATILLLAACCFAGCTSLGDGIVSRGLARDNKRRVMDLTSRRPVLTKRESKRLDREIRRRIPQEDVQMLLVDNVENGFSPKEMVAHLFHEWKIGEDMSDRGILILVAMEQNRIEIEFGHGLAHFMNEEWCQEMLISKVVPAFRRNEYASGLREAIFAIEDLLSGHDETMDTRHRPRKGKWAALAAMIGLGHYTANRRDHDPRKPPPPPSANESPSFRGFQSRREGYPKRGKQDWFRSNKESSNRSKEQESKNSGRQYRSAPLFHLDDFVRFFAGLPSGRHQRGPKRDGSTTFNIYNSPPPRDSHQFAAESQEKTTIYHNPLEQQSNASDNVFTSESGGKIYPRTSAPKQGATSCSATKSTIPKVNDNNTSSKEGHQTTQKDVSIKPPRASSGGGASWSTPTSPTMPPSAISPKRGAGTTWSSNAARKPNPPSKDRSQNGGGASW